MVGKIYPSELQLNQANSSDTDAPFLDLELSITNCIVSSKIYDKQDNFNFEIINHDIMLTDRGLFFTICGGCDTCYLICVCMEIVFGYNISS